jgi:hypothetical protein
LVPVTHRASQAWHREVGPVLRQVGVGESEMEAVKWWLEVAQASDLMPAATSPHPG